MNFIKDYLHIKAIGFGWEIFPTANWKIIFIKAMSIENFLINEKI
jgi:hypothetical protein